MDNQSQSKWLRPLKLEFDDKLSFEVIFLEDFMFPEPNKKLPKIIGYTHKITNNLNAFTMSIEEFANEIQISHSGNGYGFVHHPYLIMGKSATGSTTEYVRDFGLQMAAVRTAVAINNGHLEWAWFSCDMGDNQMLQGEHVVIAKVSYDMQVLEIGVIPYMWNLKGIMHTNTRYTSMLRTKIEGFLNPYICTERSKQSG